MKAPGMHIITKFLLLVTLFLVPGRAAGQCYFFDFNNFGENASPGAPIYGPDPWDPHQQLWGNATNALPSGWPNASIPGKQIYRGGPVGSTNYSVEAYYSLTNPSDTFALNATAMAVPGSRTQFYPFGVIFPDAPEGGYFGDRWPNMPDVIVTNMFGGTQAGAFLQVVAWDNDNGQLASWADAWNAALAGSGRAVGWSKVFFQLTDCPPGGGIGLIYFESFNLFIISEGPVVADASATKKLWVSANGTNARVTLDASRAFDPDRDALLFYWSAFPANVLTNGIKVDAVLPLGMNTVHLAVNDGSIYATTNVTVEVITMVEAVVRLIELANSSVSRPHPYGATLSGALAAIQRGDAIPAINQLQAFRNQVNAQISKNDAALSQRLIRFGQEIIDALSVGCGKGAAGRE